MLYGTEKGTIGHLAVSLLDSTKALSKTWELPDGPSGTAGSGGRGVNALSSFDLTQDGIEELIVGRGDGSVTVRRPAKGRGALGIEDPGRRRHEHRSPS